VVFYEMLTGELPVGRFAAPSERVQVDVRLDEVVLKALAKEPQRRYQQASQVKTDVETIVNTPGAQDAPPVIEPPTVLPSPRGASSRPLAFLALGLFLAGLLVTLLLLAIVPVRDEMALLFGVTAEVLALVFGLIAWRERLGRFVAMATVALFALAGSGSLFYLLSKGLSHSAATQAQAERAAQADLQARLQAEQAAVATQAGKLYTQEQTYDLQPDGLIRFKSRITQQNQTRAPLQTIQFMNSDFVEVTKIFDEAGRDLPFGVSQQGRAYRYRVTLLDAVPPDEWFTYGNEGTMKGLIRNVPNTGLFEYRMRHSPGVPGVTRRLETHRLPPGAVVLDAQPADLQRRDKDGRVELHLDREIPRGGNLEVVYRYRLEEPLRAAGPKAAVRQAVELVSTCADGDPRIQDALKLLRSLEAAEAVPALAGHLDEAEPTQRRAAIYLLQNGGWTDIAAAAPKLTELLSHEEGFTRGMAALALGQGKVTASFEPIARMATNDVSSYARRCAAYALGLLGDARGEAVLNHVLQDSDPHVKANATAALELLRQAPAPTSAPVKPPAPPKGASLNPGLLNEEQRLVLAWTDRQFRSFFDRRDFAVWKAEDRAQLEERSLDALNGPRSREYYQAIGTLGALRTTNALPPLLALATDRAEKDCRDRWMAIRALGMIGDRAVVPELVPLVYHGNVNTRWWAQLTLVRLTGTNFGSDWRAWASWWNAQALQPPVSTNDWVIWYKDPAFSDPERLPATLAESDRKFLESVRQTVPAAEATPR
jgi:HEAT repeat protein